MISDVENMGAWSQGPVGDGVDGSEELRRLLGGVGAGEEDGALVVTGPLACPYCRWDRFEVVVDECFCEGCCLPLDVLVEDVEGGGGPVARELRPPGAARAGAAAGMVGCPAGHELFQVAAAYTLGPGARFRRLRVGLRCPDDGALGLLVDDARIPPAVDR
ncbi:hypothetical protein [Streptomyces sp. NPDC004330]|uniref:hypothetical protein n=1 Tax=Streptomyces sp. NPDC004330 TaxID=3364700 RepID=UPI00367D117D